MRQMYLSLVLAAGLALPALADGQGTPPAAPTPPAPSAPAAATPTPTPTPTPTAAPAAPNRWEIPADAKPVERKELEGGLIIEDFVVGTGAEFQPGATVVINYHGTLKDGGKVFDSSFERGQPVAFPLGQLIPGWQKGIPGMKIGGLRRLTIPYAMAYGEGGRPPTIPAKSDLVFIVEALGTPNFVDLAPGTGDATVSAVSVVIANHRFIGKDGKVLHETPPGKPYIWFPGEMPGLGEQLAGMKVGGKRKITIPGAMVQPMPGSEVQLPAGEDVTAEFEVVMFRNLPGGPGGR